MRMRKKKWVRPFLDEEKVYLANEFSEIKTDLPIYMEIGMGMGDWICNSASLNKDIFYLGLEKDETCVARAIIKAREMGLENIKIMLMNANLVSEIIPEKAIDCIYLHFSDPWPKSGHHKRRLTYPTFLESYKTILKDEGTIIFKTDNKDFFVDSLEYFKEANLNTDDISYDYHAIERNEPLTGYESKFKELGQPIHFIKLSKQA
ncbi:MAG: tRNA (guanosine(46)-N7)-methyltransferase TrmB [Erysipelotrichaceae bacterium]|nr:tRNA (guanosine(46)-N7)-methyltransferase TrmB [Erysipelotrichaceae bacterium]